MKKWIAFIVFIFPLWVAWSSAVDQMVPAEFLEQLKNEKTVSVIHEEEDENLTLVPRCFFQAELNENRIVKNSSPYTAEFLYLISKSELMESGTGNYEKITIEDVAEILTAISTMSGMRYRFSENHPEGSLLYREVYTMESLKSKKKIPDDIRRNCDGLKVLCYQHDRLLGDLKFALDYRQRNDEIYLTIRNKVPLGLFGIHACKEDNLALNIHVTDLGDDILFYISADANYDNVFKMFSIRGFIKKLMNERLDAIYRWFFLRF